MYGKIKYLERECRLKRWRENTIPRSCRELASPNIHGD